MLEQNPHKQFLGRRATATFTEGEVLTVEAANLTRHGSRSITRTPLPAGPAYYPGEAAQVLINFFPGRAAFPQSQRGRHPQHHF